jgi:hypothetical protein
MVPNDTARMVMVNPTVKSADRTTTNTAQWRSIGTRRPNQRRSRMGHGTTPSSSTPTESTFSVRGLESRASAPTDQDLGFNDVIAEASADTDQRSFWSIVSALVHDCTRVT